MFCSGCGQAMEPGQAFCPKCGRPVAPAVPPVPGLQFQLESYAGKVRLLGIFWLVYAGLTLVMGLAGLTFAKEVMSGGLGPWMHGPVPPMWLGPAFIHLIWVSLVVRAMLAAAAGWGLIEHSRWGRLVAIVIAILSLIRFPFGTALGIWTLVMLLGYRNSALYDQL
ncbi:MAG TPA: zinc ribbon domain-containing protein [Terracidiphilus sp.]|jgi:zinc-ribbon domain|nr:zinc ribbon domain-containing protein [Terracidiphilus sp.]HUX27328.1 zinc ribbon domain-containing protein [Terracidiphilus sp.]